MTPYSIKFFSAEDLALFERVKQLVFHLPDLELGETPEGIPILISCHMLCHGLSRILGLKYEDGFYHPNYQHSWLITNHDNIIDAYPVGALGGPLMTMRQGFSPGKWLYVKKPAREVVGNTFQTSWYKRSLERVREELEKIHREL